jgi:ABC-2 type transport system permease protein
MASKTLLVAEREYLENIRTKTFWIGILALPILLAISIGAGWVLNKLKETKSYAVVNYGEPSLARKVELAARTPDLRAFQALQKQLGKAVAELPEDGELLESDAADRAFQAWMELPAADVEKLAEENKGFDTARRFRHVRLSDLELDALAPAEQEERLNRLVGDGKLFAYFTLGAQPATSLEGFKYVSNNLTDNDLRDWYSRAATNVVQRLRIVEARIPSDVAKRLQERVSFREQKVGAEGKAEDVKIGEKATKWAPVAFVYLLWIAVFTAAQMLLTNTIEEKSNRIIEVLLSSVSPHQLMAGKVWGIAATGLTIVVSWALCALLAAWLAPKLIANVDLPWMAIVGDPLYLVSFVAYFLLGYLLYAAILVGLGSVCNSLKEAQNLLQPVFLLLIVPLISMMFIVQEPNGLVAKVLSYVPLFTPFTMMNRAGGPPEAWEYAVTGVLLLASVWFAFRAAGKVFRVGVLMTGNPPKLKEVLGWLRER